MAIKIINSTILHLNIENINLQNITNILINKYSAEELAKITQCNIEGSDALNSLIYNYDYDFEQILPNIATLVICEHIYEINIINSTKLKEIYLECINTNEINIINCANLVTFEKSQEYNTIKNANIQNNKNLSFVYLQSDLQNINIENCPNIMKLDLSNNLLTDIDISNLIKLQNLDLSYNKLTNIDLSNNINLIQLNISDNKIEELLIKNNEIQRIIAEDNKIKNINISGNSLYLLYLDNNCIDDITELFAQNLRELKIVNNNVQIEINDILQRFKKLENLNIDIEQINLFVNRNLQINIFGKK